MGLQGAGRVYDDFLRPFLAAHEADIDRGLLELRARAADATASRLQAAVALARCGWRGDGAASLRAAAAHGEKGGRRRKKIGLRRINR